MPSFADIKQPIIELGNLSLVNLKSRNMIWLRTSSAVCHQLTTKTTSILLVLLLLVAVALCSGEVKHSEKRCLVDEPAPERKFLTHNSEKEVITLLGSPRIASR